METIEKCLFRVGKIFLKKFSRCVEELAECLGGAFSESLILTLRQRFSLVLKPIWELSQNETFPFDRRTGAAIAARWISLGWVLSLYDDTLPYANA